VLEKAYDPKAVEDRIYKMWEESGAFKADVNSTKEPFTISMPPPNATGQLHLGHAVMLALEDIFTRFARMNGKEALWLPGTDHAAIATESVVIKKIQKEEKIGNPRTKYGREGLVAKIAEFVEQSRGTIRGQVRKMGSSCDWSRESYTMDPALNRCVNEVFASMYRDGLIYRANRVVNWDIALQTTISDDEIEYQDTEATLYTIEYLTAEQTGGEPVYVSTSRPETKLGDTALVVHPDDKRYKHLIGKTFTVDWPRGQSIEISVIADHTIDPAFGTGVLGLTPFHSKIDYEIWQRHKDECAAHPLSVIGEDGRITGAIQGYSGMTIEECREAFVADLKEAGRIHKEEKYVQPLSVSYRSKKPVEPLPKLQWFIDVNKKFDRWQGKWAGKSLSLKEVMLEVVRDGEIRIIPDRFEKTYFQWIENLQDWCISRQIWWGHRVPVWYNGEEIYCGAKAPEGKDWTQDEDTLDTWFSSALWTWSTLVDPKLTEDYSLSLKDILDRSPDFQKFHPTAVMETGYDIIFFWVARMILMTTYATGQIPFKTVYLHGLIRTRDGKKMSKSDPSTMIDPLDMIGNYGADALRLSMIVGQSPGADSRLYEEKIAGYRNFINKLWNASRFVLMQCEAAGVDPHSIETLPDPSKLSLADRAILHASEILIEDVTKGLETYSLSEAGEKLYSFTWDTFCDWYLELSKGTANLDVLVHVLRRILMLLHPYCPFITEELWLQIKRDKYGMLIAKSWPLVKEKHKDAQAFNNFQILIDVITAIRKLRTDQSVEPGKEVAITLVTQKHSALAESQEAHIRRLGKVGSLTVTDAAVSGDVASVFLADIEVHLSLEGLVDTEKEKANLTKEKENLERFIGGIEAKLGNKQFIGKAPAQLVEEQKGKLEEAKGKLEKIEERLKSL
jgi:valyl-tRNA synthetase